MFASLKKTINKKNQIFYTVPTKWVAEHFHYGLAIWDGDMKEKQIPKNILDHVPFRIRFSWNTCSGRSDWDNYYEATGMDRHAARIRHICVTPSILNKPIEIGGRSVYDGNHRLSAHVYLNREVIRIKTTCKETVKLIEEHAQLGFRVSEDSKSESTPAIGQEMVTSGTGD